MMVRLYLDSHYGGPPTVVAYKNDAFIDEISSEPTYICGMYYYQIKGSHCMIDQDDLDRLLKKQT